jgi:ABC-2 type transport system permease protein
MNVASASFRGLVAKEVKALFTSTIAYTVVAVFLVLMSYTFATTLVVTQTATLGHIFYQAALLLLLLVPVLTMRLFAEERRNGTLELLLASPIREFEVVLAKFVATMLVILIMLGLSLSYPFTLAIFGTPEWGPIYSGYLGLILLAGALVALGLGLSALATNQIVAAVLSIGLFFLLWTIDQLAAFVPAPIDQVATDLSLSARLAPFLTGAMYFADLGYFLSLILFGLLFSVRALARR